MTVRPRIALCTTLAVVLWASTAIAQSAPVDWHSTSARSAETATVIRTVRSLVAEAAPAEIRSTDAALRVNLQEGAGSPRAVRTGSAWTVVIPRGYVQRLYYMTELFVITNAAEDAIDCISSYNTHVTDAIDEASRMTPQQFASTSESACADYAAAASLTPEQRAAVLQEASFALAFVYFHELGHVRNQDLPTPAASIHEESVCAQRRRLADLRDREYRADRFAVDLSFQLRVPQVVQSTWPLWQYDLLADVFTNESSSDHPASMYRSIRVVEGFRDNANPPPNSPTRRQLEDILAKLHGLEAKVRAKHPPPVDPAACP